MKIRESRLCLAMLIVGSLTTTFGCSREYVEQPSGIHDPDAVTTADELFAELETPLDYSTQESHRTSNLPKSELEVAVKVLREQHPVVSVRDRMHFQSKHPAPVVRTPSGEGRRYRDGFFTQRARALAELHSDEVYQFINRNGQGMMRMPRPQPSDLRYDADYATKIERVEVDSTILGEAIVDLAKSTKEPTTFGAKADELSFSPNGMPKMELASWFHSVTTFRFADLDSLGHVKSVDEVAGFEAHRARFSKNWTGDIRIYPKQKLENRHPKPSGLDITWKVNRLQLVGLLMHDQPVVYETENLPNMEELSGADAETRTLDAFEEESLVKIKDGEDVVTVATHNRIRMMGAIRAGKSCLECHSTKEEDLLGAFSYEFLRDPREPEPKSDQAP